MTNCSRADARAGSSYPFLTRKERDVETGLDYFLARYYSSTQGRFTSPDEFSGGPDELYYFAEGASANPTFYADLRNPQSLNKYQYAYNNPLRYVDPDGHNPLDPPQDPACPCMKGPTDQQIIESGKAVIETVAKYTGIAALADALRKYGPAVGKAILDQGGKSAMQQDMDDLAGRYPWSKRRAVSRVSKGSRILGAQIRTTTTRNLGLKDQSLRRTRKPPNKQKSWALRKLEKTGENEPKDDVFAPRLIF